MEYTKLKSETEMYGTNDSTTVDEDDNCLISFPEVCITGYPSSKCVA